MDAHAEVRKLLDQLRDRAKVFSPKVQEEFNSVTDSIETLTRAYMAPEVPDWSRYGLTRYETRLLEALHARYGRAVSREALLDATSFDKDLVSTSRTIDVHLMRIRRKLTEFKAPFQVETVAGIGLKLVDADKAFVRPVSGACGALHKARALQALKAA